MPPQEFQKNIPHLIALAVLILALLLIATKTGLVSCSSLGQGYCDVYYSVVGKPTVLIIRGDEGMGSPDALARMIEDQHQLPVQKLRVDQISKGNIEDYSLIVVERAREIPTEKLKVFNDYLFEDMGRLVWVGDAGTIGASSDETCRLMTYTAEWNTGEGKDRQEYEENICVKENEIFSSSEDTASTVLSMKRDLLVEKAFNHIDTLCEDAFEGSLGVSEKKGYPCEGASYENVYFNWLNEKSFRNNINPWSRGEYEKLTTDTKESGIDFAKSVLGVGFVADDFAVAEFDAYYNDIDAVRDGLINAHTGFVACSRNISDVVCNVDAKAVIVSSSLNAVKKQKDNAKTDLSGITTTLNSLAQQKEAKNESGYEATAASQKITLLISDIEAVNVPEDIVSVMQITQLEKVVNYLETIENELVQLRGGETDSTLQANYDLHISTVESRINSYSSAVNNLKTSVASYNECSGEEVSTVVDVIASETDYQKELKELIAYSSPLIDETGAVDFIKHVQSGSNWGALANKLENVSLQCGGSDFTTGMASAAEAIITAEEAVTNPALESNALASMQVADIKHPLVEGVTRAKDLKKDDLPVPFVLVETNDVNSHEVIQLRVTPAYKGANTWPGITVKDPKFASHLFGKGVVVYYAFPPETDEVFVKNLIEFMLY